MKFCTHPWCLASIMMVLMSLSSVQTYASSEQDSKSKTGSYLTEDDVRQIVREELAKNKSTQKKQSLSSLLNEYSQANESARSMTYGNGSARFTLQMYSDIECPYCRKMFFDVKKVVDFSEGVINWEYKHFPLQIHNPAAATEAQAIECIAEEQGMGKAWVALEQFVKTTQGNGKGLNQEIPEFVRSFGLNGSLLQNCLLTDEPKQRVNNDYSEGKQLGISATPAILLKDNKYGKDYLIKGFKTSEQLLQAINSIM